jgi:hypothetical protein
MISRISTNVAFDLNCMLLMGTWNRISDLAPPQVDSDATNKKYVDTNSWSVRGNPLESETIDNTRVIGTLGEENFSIIRNNQLCLLLMVRELEHLKLLFLILMKVL